MTANEVLRIISTLNNANIPVWIDGGWGVDALIGQQTREHEDLDVVIALANVETVKDILGEQGFVVLEDELPTRIVLKGANTQQIDFHTVTFNTEGGAIQKLQDSSVYRYKLEGLNGNGSINGHAVKCITPEEQAASHYGYEPDEKDKHDMQLLQKHFGIELTKPYFSS